MWEGPRSLDGPRVDRAAKAGFDTLLVTVDAGGRRRLRDKRNGILHPTATHYR
jgi:isopentenyl diphosphate isomerase/L-lactate dehydrogenase-like FMN-dependent dehydrogenase